MRAEEEDWDEIDAELAEDDTDYDADGLTQEQKEQLKKSQES